MGSGERALLKQLSLCLVAFTFLCGVGVVAVTAIAQERGNQGKAEAAAARPINHDLCAPCHQQVVQGFALSPHGKLASLPSSSETVCETCHGPAKAHVESKGDSATILNPQKLSPEEVNRRCLGCHSNQLADFSHSVHGTAKLSCISCHAIHGEKSGQHLLKESEPALCLQCHAEVRTQFSMPFHHPVVEGRMNCSDCHDPHRIVSGATRQVADVNATCAKCHRSEAGPFTYEHKAMQTEGCMGCHSVHGSQNIHQLTQKDVDALCESCHSVSGSAAHPQNWRAGGHSDARSARKTCCIDCHAQFHGSNADPTLLR